MEQLSTQKVSEAGLQINIKRALVTGASGQDASYLIPLLLEKGYQVHGMLRRSSNAAGRLRYLKDYEDKVIWHYGDLSDASSLTRIIAEVQPDELYNLAAQADVGESFALPEMSIDVNGLGVVRQLEAIKRFSPHTKFYQASTSELFGAAEESPQNERSRMNPQSPYSIGKWVAYRAVQKHREAGYFACNGILFNHESPHRGEDYLTRKVTKAVARIKMGLQEKLTLGNLESKRDWGYAKEYMEVAWLMMQQDTSDDYCIGTGETHTVKEWVEAAFNSVGLNWEDHVIQDIKYFRPAEVDVLQADYSKANRILGWEPKTKFNELVHLMVGADLQLAEEEKWIKNK